MDESRRPSPWKRPAVRPEIRPVAVWIISMAFVLIGLLFVYAGVTTFAHAFDIGDEDAQFPSLLGALIGLLTILFAAGLFFGARWGRTGALAVCAIMFVLMVIGLMEERISPWAAMLVFAVTLSLFFAVLGQKADAWTGGS